MEALAPSRAEISKLKNSTRKKNIRGNTVVFFWGAKKYFSPIHLKLWILIEGHEI